MYHPAQFISLSTEGCQEHGSHHPLDFPLGCLILEDTHLPIYGISRAAITPGHGHPSPPNTLPGWMGHSLGQFFSSCFSVVDSRSSNHLGVGCGLE